MPTSARTQIAEAVKTSLNTAAAADEFVERFEAQRTYLPEFRREDMDALHVTVFARGASHRRESRAGFTIDYLIDVAIQRQIDPTEVEGADELDYLREQVIEHLKRAGKMGDAVLVPTVDESEPIFSHMDELDQYTAVTTFTYRLIRE